MKKMIIFVLTLILMLSLTQPVSAAGEGFSLSDADAQPGEIIYLTATLNESAVANAVGVTYSYDSAILEAVPSSCSWVKTGVLQDFNSNGAGVWASAESEDLKGAVCILAFRVKSGASFSKTKITCTVIVKNDSTEVGSYTAEATVSMTCNHTYGEWTDQGGVGHTQVCASCNSQLTESHTWNEGVRSPKPNDPNIDLMTYTCNICNGTKVVEMPAENIQEIQPMLPDVTTPSATTPEYPTMPPADRPQPEYPTTPVFSDDLKDDQNDAYEENQGASANQGNTGNQNQIGNQGGTGNQNYTGNQGNTGNQIGIQGSTGNQNHTGNQSSIGNRNDQETTPYHDFNEPTSAENDGHDHEHSNDEAAPTIPMIVPASPEQETTEHDHDHDHDITTQVVSNKERGINAIMIVVFLVITITAAVYFVKKKH